MRKWMEFIKDAGFWGVASELASLVLYILGIVTVTKWGITFGTVVMLVGTVPLFWIGAFVAWNKKYNELELEKTRNTKPEIVGRILILFVRGTGTSGANPNSFLGMKLSVSTKTNVDTTLKDADLVLQTNGRTYKGQRIPLGKFDIFQGVIGGGAASEKMNDLVFSITYSNPIRYRVASEGWLSFVFDGLDCTSPIQADLTFTLTDAIDEKHIMVMKDIPIRNGNPTYLAH